MAISEELLEKQVEMLEKLLQLKGAVIEELEAKVNKLEMEKAAASYPYSHTHTYTVPNFISNPCIDGSAHNYPSYWNGTNTPNCTKCGRQQPAATSGYISISGVGSTGNLTTVGGSALSTDTTTFAQK